jgi:hypothetical protein
VKRTCARSCRRRGDLEASTTLSRLSLFKHGMSSGGGGPRGGRGPGGPEGDLGCALGMLGLSVYGGGGSDGRRSFDMVAVGCDASTMGGQRIMGAIRWLNNLRE